MSGQDLDSPTFGLSIEQLSILGPMKERSASLYIPGSNFAIPSIG